MTTLEQVIYELQFLTEKQLQIVYDFLQELKARDKKCLESVRDGTIPDADV